MNNTTSDPLNESGIDSGIILSMHQTQKVLNVKRCIEKNTSPTLTRNKTKIKYTIKVQSSPHELIFEIELNPNLLK